MQRIFTGLTTAALVLGLAAGAWASDTKMSGHAMGGSMGMKKGHTCAPGKKWVHGYTKKDGTKVKGYCR